MYLYRSAHSIPTPSTSWILRLGVAQAEGVLVALRITMEGEFVPHVRVRTIQSSNLAAMLLDHRQDDAPELPDGLSLGELATLPLSLPVVPGTHLLVDVVATEPARLVALAVVRRLVRFVPR